MAFGNALVGNHLEDDSDNFGIKGQFINCDIAVQLDKVTPTNFNAEAYEAGIEEAKALGLRFRGNVVERVMANTFYYGFNVQSNHNFLADNEAINGSDVEVAYGFETYTSLDPTDCPDSSPGLVNAVVQEFSSGFVVGNNVLAGLATQPTLLFGTGYPVEHNLLQDNVSSNSANGFAFYNLLDPNSNILDITNVARGNDAYENDLCGFCIYGTGNNVSGSLKQLDLRNTAEFNGIAGIAVTYLPAAGTSGPGGKLGFLNLVNRNTTKFNYEYGIAAGSTTLTGVCCPIGELQPPSSTYPMGCSIIDDTFITETVLPSFATGFIENRANNNTSISCSDCYDYSDQNMACAMLNSSNPSENLATLNFWRGNAGYYFSTATGNPACTLLN